MDGVEQEEPRKASGCAAVMVVTFFTAVPLGGLWITSRDLFILTVWAIAWAAVVWAARKPVPNTANPAPPPSPEGVAEEEPQVSLMRDKSHPNRWVVTRPSRWMTADTDKTGTS